MIKHYGFIVKSDNYDFHHDKTTMSTADFTTNTVGVSCDDDAILVAQKMIEDGVQVIELCGAFGAESADYIISCLDTNIPIGYVTFSKNENQKLERILAGNSDLQQA